MKKSTKAWSMKMRLALLTLAALVWIAVPVSARAETDVWNGTIASGFAVGTGTENDPYQINTAAELAYFAKSVNDGKWYDGEYIILKNNINRNYSAPRLGYINFWSKQRKYNFCFIIALLRKVDNFSM